MQIDGAIFAVWVRLLRSVPNSVLWLRRESEDAHQALRDTAVLQGLSDPRRVVFAKWAPASNQHLQR